MNQGLSAETASCVRLLENLERAVFGKRAQLEVVVGALLAGGHVLLEDVPGVGKTLLARALARSIRGEFRRLQCTPDLLPSDITGVSVYNPKDLSFEFRPGPVFANVLLADELNRATPRTQSALLEAMEERQVTVEGAARPLPAPFFLVATQNPIELAGTFPLPEAQLDRFMVRLSLGYPDGETSLRILRSQRDGDPLQSVEAILGLDQLQALQGAVSKVFVHESLLRYIESCVQATRAHDHAAYGASPRGAIALLRSSQALALIRGERFVSPDTIQRLAPNVLGHRIVVKPRSRIQGVDGARIVEESMRRVAVPVDLSSSA